MQLILDLHAHLGPWHDSPGQFLSAELLADAIDSINEGAYRVEGVLVSNLAGIDTLDHQPGSQPLFNQYQANEQLLDLCAGDARLIPAAVCQPGWGIAAQMAELLAARRFYALKFHPFYLGIPASDERYDPFLQLARAAKLPCVFHAAPGDSDPEQIAALAQRFPDVPVVLYHINLMGDPYHGIQVVHRALQAGSTNLYLEASWCEPQVVVDAVRAVGRERVLFGSDAPLGPFAEPGYYGQQVKELAEALQAAFPGDLKVVPAFFYENARSLLAGQRG